MRQCHKCGATLLETTDGIEICKNCGASATRTGWASDNIVNMPLTIPKEPVRVLETDINDLTIRVGTLEADLERIKSDTSEDMIHLNESVKVLKDEVDHLRKLLNARCENLLDQIGELREKCDGPKLTILSAEDYEKAKEDLLKALSENNAMPIIELPKPIRYVYIIRERTDNGWEVVGNICYPTFNDANEKMKKLIKDFRQLEPDYDANDLNIIQVRLSE